MILIVTIVSLLAETSTRYEAEVTSLGSMGLQLMKFHFKLIFPYIQHVLWRKVAISEYMAPQCSLIRKQFSI